MTDRAFRLYNAVRMAAAVFWFLLRDDRDDLVYRQVGVSRFGIEKQAVLMARGREAWRISHLAIDAWRRNP